MITARRQIAPAGGPRRGVIAPAAGPPRRRFRPAYWPASEVLARGGLPGARGRAPRITRGAVWPGVRRPEFLSAAPVPRSRGITLRGARSRPGLLRASLSPVVPRVSLSPVVARATLRGARSRPGLLRAGLLPTVILPTVIAEATLCRGRSRPGVLRVARGPVSPRVQPGAGERAARNPRGRSAARNPAAAGPGRPRGRNPESPVRRGSGGGVPLPRPGAASAASSWRSRGRSKASSSGSSGEKGFFGCRIRVLPDPLSYPPARDHEKNRWLVHSFPGDHAPDSVTIRDLPSDVCGIRALRGPAHLIENEACPSGSGRMARAWYPSVPSVNRALTRARRALCRGIIGGHGMLNGLAH